MVKNLPSKARDLSGFDPGSGTEIPHAAGKLSLGTSTRESLHAATKTQCS